MMTFSKIYLQVFPSVDSYPEYLQWLGLERGDGHAIQVSKEVAGTLLPDP